MYEVRIADSREISVILDLEAERRAAGAGWIMGQNEVASRVTDGRVLVAVDGDQVIAYLSYAWLGSLPWIEFIWLREPYRRQGLGTSMLRVLETRLRADGHRILMSSTSLGEQPPLDWHLAVGFKECGIIVYDRAGSDRDVVLRKAIV
jgi:GNAT superfamily N-acetyltransferase